MRLLEIDGLRGIAILTILIQHLVLFDPITYVTLPIIGLSQYTTVTLLGVPVFFFISALVLAYNYRKRKFSVMEFYKSRIFYIGIPYLIWAAIFMIVYDQPFTDLSHVLFKCFSKTATGRWVSLNFRVLIIFLAALIATVLFPVFSKVDCKIQRRMRKSQRRLCN